MLTPATEGPERREGGGGARDICQTIKGDDSAQSWQQTLMNPPFNWPRLLIAPQLETSRPFGVTQLWVEIYTRQGFNFQTKLEIRQQFLQN